KEPFVWFLDMLSNPFAVPIVAKEVLDKHGDFKKVESVIGTGPWMLDSYRPNVGLTYVRNPTFYMAGLPYIERVEATVDEDNASRMAAFLSGKYDLGWEFPGTINRTDWVQIKDTLKQKRPKLQTVEFAAPVMMHLSMCFTNYGSTLLVDVMQLVTKGLKAVGIDAKIDQKEYGAYISTCFYGKFEAMTFGPQTGFLEPDNFLFGQYYPEELKNQSHIN